MSNASSLLYLTFIMIWSFLVDNVSKKSTRYKPCEWVIRFTALFSKFLSNKKSEFKMPTLFWSSHQGTPNTTGSSFTRNINISSIFTRKFWYSEPFTKLITDMVAVFMLEIGTISLVKNRVIQNGEGENEIENQREYN